jgi:hypothetical protein
MKALIYSFGRACCPNAVVGDYDACLNEANDIAQRVALMNNKNIEEAKVIKQHLNADDYVEYFDVGKVDFVDLMQGFSEFNDEWLDAVDVSSDNVDQLTNGQRFSNLRYLGRTATNFIKSYDAVPRPLHVAMDYTLSDYAPCILTMIYSTARKTPPAERVLLGLDDFKIS